jgi:transposase
VRTYRRKKLLDPDRRMAVAVRLSAEGLSLRQTAARLSVSYQTVARDLARWEQVRSAMPLKIVRLSRPAVTNVPPRGRNVTPRCDTGADVIPLRRTS